MACLWITKNNGCLRRFAEFVPTQKRYHTPCEISHICRCDFNGVGTVVKVQRLLGGGKGYDSWNSGEIFR